VSLPRTPPDKPATTLDEQIERLRRRGMQVDDVARARHYLGHLNYYRLRGYWMCFESQGDGQEEHFRPGTCFDDVVRLYDFDRRLRLDINDAVERVEVSLRTRWAYVLAHHGGCVAHRDSGLFNEHHDKLLDRMDALYGERNEVFLKRYLDRGEEPPIWAFCEVLTLGQLSKWLSSILDRKLRVAIAEPYGMRECAWCSFVRQLAYVRNLCAHHGRVWNRQLVVGTLQLPKKPETLATQLQHDPETKASIYNILALLAWTMRIISPGSAWRTNVRTLMEQYPDLWEDVGFPADWNKFELWQSDDAEVAE
jgi:abortive infection bacteriophage resistance protein